MTYPLYFMIYFHTLHKNIGLLSNTSRHQMEQKETVNERIRIQGLNKVLGETNKATNTKYVITL